jgi:hypothetical protein
MGTPLKGEGITYFVIPTPYQARDKLQRESRNIWENQIILVLQPPLAGDDELQ